MTNEQKVLNYIDDILLQETERETVTLDDVEEEFNEFCQEVDGEQAVI